MTAPFASKYPHKLKVPERVAFKIIMIVRRTSDEILKEKYKIKFESEESDETRLEFWRSKP